MKYKTKRRPSGRRFRLYDFSEEARCASVTKLGARKAYSGSMRKRRGRPGVQEFISNFHNEICQLLEDEVQLGALWRSFSQERLGRYLAACSDEPVKALTLYKRNLQISSGFYVPLQCFEITLRNKLNEEMVRSFDGDWHHRSDFPVESDTYDWIQSAIKQVSFAGASNGSIVAELSLGFWVSLLAQRYAEALWKKCLFRAFTCNGRYMNRKLVHQRLNALRRFRNRVAHHEPIIFNDLANTYTELIEAVSWMCPITAEWTAEQSSVTQQLR